MNEIYKQMWNLAKPYYEKGRPYDVPHIEWMVGQVERLAQIEDFNKDLLMPICILHDVGYSTLTKKNPNIKCKNAKSAHMEAGAKISEEILGKINYDKEISKKVVYYISVHDNWCLGDNAPYKECKEMALFNDFDYLYAISNPTSFKFCADSMKKTIKEFYDFYTTDEKLINRPFCCEETKKMFEQYKKDRGNELN